MNRRSLSPKSQLLYKNNNKIFSKTNYPNRKNNIQNYSQNNNTKHNPLKNTKSLKNQQNISFQLKNSK